MKKKRYFEIMDMDYNSLPVYPKDTDSLPQVKRMVKKFLKENNLSSALIQINDFKTENIIGYREVFV